jgi:carboxyl-terminal processing protease
MDIKIKRETIYLPNVTYSVLNKWVCYMDINQFNTNTLSQFEQWLSFFQKNWCSKYIFDLRDNPGWELDTVVNMLNHFVNGWNIIIELQYSNYIQDIIANNIWSKLNDKDIIILVNKSTASASEVFAGTIRDYVKKTTLMWEQTYWKWTAQSIIQYDDWSALKYTIAKRYTWKTKTNVDWVGLKPNITLTNDEINTLLQELQKHND